MKLFKYYFLILLLFFPLNKYAVLEDDLVQLVTVLQIINPLLPVLPEKEIEAGTLSGEISQAFDTDEYKKVVSLIFEYVKGYREKKSGFDESWVDFYIGEMLPFAASKVLSEYNNNFGIQVANEKDADSLVEKITTFFNIDTLLQTKEKLEHIINFYSRLLTAARTSPESGFDESYDSIAPQSNLANFIKILELKNLTNIKQYQEMKNRLAELEQEYGSEIPLTSEEKKIEPLKTIKRPLGPKGRKLPSRKTKEDLKKKLEEFEEEKEESMEQEEAKAKEELKKQQEAKELEEQKEHD